MKQEAVSRLLLRLPPLVPLCQRTRPPLCPDAPNLSETKDIVKGGCKIMDLPEQPHACIGSSVHMGRFCCWDSLLCSLIKGNRIPMERKKENERESWMGKCTPSKTPGCGGVVIDRHLFSAGNLEPPELLIPDH